jgi:hypothetical protein
MSIHYWVSVVVCILLSVIYIIKTPKNKNGTNTKIQDSVFIFIVSSIPVINILFIIFLYYSAFIIKDDNKQNDMNMLISRFYNKKGEIYHTKVEYLGGYPELIETGKYDFKLFNNETYIYSLNKQVILNNTNIIRAELINQTQVVNNPKLSNLLLFGIVGLGINNKDIEEIYCVSIEYKYDNKNITILFRINEPYKSKEIAATLYTNINYVISKAS